MPFKRGDIIQSWGGDIMIVAESPEDNGRVFRLAAVADVTHWSYTSDGLAPFTVLSGWEKIGEAEI